MGPLPRREFLSLGGGVVAAAAGFSPTLTPVSTRRAPTREATIPHPSRLGDENDEARFYYRLLLLHTRWVETLWDDAVGHYPLADYNIVHVLGNAVLLTMGDYDADLAGVSRDTLRDHTLATIDYAARTNFYATGSTWGDGGYEWGGAIFWDGTMESYFVAAARLLWDDLSAETREAVDAIAIGGAEYVASLEDTEDPRSGGWSSNGLKGGYRADSKIEEMGAKSMPLATGLAYFPDHPSAPRWREWLTRWMSNMTGLPSADRHNHTLLEGRPVSWWNEAHNIFDTYIVENHGSYAPMYQESVGAYPGRNAIHFLIAGQPLPDVMWAQPNADGLWRTLRHLGTAAGLTAHPMIADRHHLYGRDVLPLTWRRLGQGDRFLARGERMLIEHLEPYLLHPPEYRLTKFTGEPKYEPEARAEVAIAYLLHRWRDRLRGDVTPVSETAYWDDVAGVTDYGADVGLLAHQSRESLAMVVTKPGYVKLAFLPEHDDWFLDVAGSAPAFLPSTQTTIEGVTTTVYHRESDGFDGTATLLRLPTGFAGYATLPGGMVVYASSGHADGEGALRLFCLRMPGVRGLDGDRTFTGPNGSVTLTDTGGDGDVDELTFPAVQTRHVRMLGVRPATQYGYSLWSFEVYAEGGDTDLARGRPTTASSSFSEEYRPEYATDGDPTTRWAVSGEERPRPDSWLAVDLGEVHTVDRVRLHWETAYGAEYRIQVSVDGQTWTDAVRVPASHTFPTGWVNVDDRVGFLVRGSRNPIRVSARSLTLSDGPAAGSAGMVIEAYPGVSAAVTASLAHQPAATTETPGLAASTAAGHLSLFNLSGADLTGLVRVPRAAERVPLYLGPGSIKEQVVNRDGVTVGVQLGAATARIAPPAFELAVDSAPDVAVRASVSDPRVVRLTNTADETCRLRLTCLATGETRPVTLPPGGTRTVRFRRR